ncbi:dihydrofolate reductase family protein [Sphingobacterium kyonggiense]|uniref:Dihydrofolate reductase family protein n=1 Tax=Sphingobacterium kyonggiense TaxID=714075 RepID=A0ABP7Y5U1_9SPHI
MRKVILNLAVTLDGFIEGSNGEIDWCIMEQEMDFKGFLDSVDTIFYGRVSYDQWGNYKVDETADLYEQIMWKKIHGMHKYVFSRQKKKDAGVTYISENVVEQVAAIKQKPGKDIWLYGGASLINSFITNDLIDKYILSVHPIALGKGKPLFEDLKQSLSLKLENTRIFHSGVIELTYVPIK